MKSTSEKGVPEEAKASSPSEAEFTKESLSDEEAQELLDEEDRGAVEEEEDIDEGSEEEKKKGPSLRERFRDADIRSKLTFASPYKTAVILFGIFLIALFLRGYFGYGPAIEHGVPYLYSGGSDSFYHQRAIEYGLSEHRHLGKDPLLNYPVGFANPRPPFFDYSTVVFGEVLSPFFGGDVIEAASFVLIWITALFGALAIVPTYALAREAFSRRAGLIAALLLAVTPAHVERSVITNADHDSVALFFVICCFYFFLRALRFMKVENWVASWHRPNDIVSGIGRMVRGNQKSSMYALMSGISFSVVALTWQGYPYILAIIVFFFIITLLLDKFRKVDPLTVTFITGVTLFSGLVIAYPYYYFWNFIGQWYDTPFLIFLIAMAVGFAFCATRDYPWLFVFPIGVIVGIAAFLLISFVNPGFQNTVASGQGYFFLRSKLYSTIAEAQPAQFSRMAVAFGMGAFLLALWGVVQVTWGYRKKPRHDYLFVVAYAIVGTAFTISQGRFLFNGAPIIAILAAFVVDRIMAITRFEDIRTTYSSMRGTKARAVVKSIKIRHLVTTLGLAFLVVIPSLWFAVDAGIPNEKKREWDLQVYKAMPDVDVKWPGIIDWTFTMRPEQYDAENGSFHYFGAFGYSLPLPSQYYSDGYEWLSRQDNEILDINARPAFISWWDYGFEAVNRGDHPTVADNFQNGYQLAGSFLMAQNDSEAMSLLVARMLEGVYGKQGKLDGPIAGALESRGVSASKLQDMLRSPASYVSIVLGNPARYGNFSQDLTAFNAKYAAMRAEITSKLKPDSIHDLWRELRSITGWDVKYFAVDSRLMVFGGSETGIFYAPAKLADKRMKGSDLTMPYDFFEIKAVSDSGQEYEPDDVPPGVNLNSQNPYKITYKRPFYNSMLYRAFVGYGPQQVNRSESNPGIQGIQGSGDMASLEPKQAHMLKHWRVAYKSAYWNPYDQENVSKHQADWQAVGWDVAQDRIEKKNGTVIQGQPDTQLWRQNGGVVMLRYYDGAVLEGAVKTSSNRFVAGARVTATDEMGVPHDSVITDASGKFRIILPFGNITVTASSGGNLDAVAMKERTELGKMELNITLAQADRRPFDRDHDGVIDWQLSKDLVVKEATVKGRLFLDSDLSGAYTDKDTLLKDHDFTVTGGGNAVQARSDAKGQFEVARLSPGPHDFATSYLGRVVAEPTFSTVGPGESASKDWMIKVGSVKGNVTSLPAEGDLKMKLIGDDRIITVPLVSDGTNGSYEFKDLNPAIYAIQVDSPELTVGVKRVQVKLGATTEANLLSREGVPLKIRAVAQTPNGVVGAAFAQFALDRHETYAPSGRGPEGPVPLQLDARGEASLVVVPGTYSVSGLYSNDGLQFAGAQLAEAYGPGGADIKIEMSRAVKLAGKLDLEGGEPGQNVRVAFYSASGARTSALGNSTGHYVTWLQAGSYNTVVQEDRVLNGFIHLSDLVLRGDVDDYDITASNGSLAEGFTYEDLNGDGVVQPGEERGGVRLLVRTKGLKFDVFSVPANGSYRVYLPEGAPAEVELGGYGWVSQSRSLVPGKTDMGMEPTLARVTGSARYRDQVVPGDLRFSFTQTAGSGNGSSARTVWTNVTDGVLSTSLGPGEWKMELKQPINAAALWSAFGEIDVKHGTDLVELDVLISKLVNLSLKSDAPGQNVTVRLNGPQRYTTNITDQGVVEIEAGNYTVEAATASQRIFFGRVDIDEFHANLSMALLPSARLHGIVAAPSPGSGIEVRFEDAVSGWAGRATTAAGGGYDTLLIANREYRVVVDHIMNETVADLPVPVLLSFDGKVFVGEGREFPIDAQKTRLTVRVAGPVTDLFGNAAIGAKILLRNAVESREVIAGSDGQLHIDEMLPGTYNLYATHASQGIPQSALASVTIPTAKSHQLPVSLRYSAYLSGKVEEDQRPFAATIRVVQSGAVHELVTGSNGAFTVLLPVGDCTIAAESKRIEWGMDVSYTASASVTLLENEFRTLEIKRADVYTSILDWPTTQIQSISQGERLNTPYVVAIENTGNVVDTWTFSGTLKDWNLTFSPPKVTLQPGNGMTKGTVLVSLQAPKDARVAHPAIVMQANSEKGKQTSTVTLDVNIAQVYGVELRKSSAEFSGASGSIKLRLDNEGNGDDNYSVRVLNDLELLSAGWQVGFRRGEDVVRSTERGVSISEGGADLDLAVNPRPNPKKSATIVLEARSLKGAAVTSISVPLTLPDLVTGEIGVEGPDARTDPDNALTPWMPLIYLGVIMPISFVLIYFFQRHGFRGLSAIIKWRVRRNLFGPRMRR